MTTENTERRTVEQAFADPGTLTEEAAGLLDLRAAFVSAWITDDDGPEIDDLVSDYFRGGPDFKSGVNAALTLIAGYRLTTLAERAKARPAVCADCLAEIEGDVTQRTAAGEPRCADCAAS